MKLIEVGKQLDSDRAKAINAMRWQLNAWVNCEFANNGPGGCTCHVFFQSGNLERLIPIEDFDFADKYLLDRSENYPK